MVRAPDCRGRGAACHRDRVSSRSYTLVPTALVRAGPRSSAPAVRIRAQVCVSASATWRLLRPSPYTYTYAYTYYLCLFIYTHMHVHVRDSHASLESQEVDPMAFPAQLACISRISGSCDPNAFSLREAHLTKMIR